MDRRMRADLITLRRRFCRSVFNSPFPRRSNEQPAGRRCCTTVPRQRRPIFLACWVSSAYGTGCCIRCSHSGYLLVVVAVRLEHHAHGGPHHAPPTERIAEGEFDARIVANRRDELGQLAQSVNRMAGRLAGHLAAQKQFLADVAHEVASPLAPAACCAGIIGCPRHPARLSEQTLQDMHDDLQQMATWLNDLLLFRAYRHRATENASRASARPEHRDAAIRA